MRICIRLYEKGFGGDIAVQVQLQGKTTNERENKGARPILVRIQARDLPPSLTIFLFCPRSLINKPSFERHCCFSKPNPNIRRERCSNQAPAISFASMRISYDSHPSRPK